MMEIVNGVACFNCTDVERAKKNGGEDQKAAGPGAARSGTQATAKIELDKADARARVDDSRKSREPLNENRPLGAGDRGTAFNILV